MRIKGETLEGFGRRSLIIIIARVTPVLWTSAMMGNSCFRETRGEESTAMIGRHRRLIEFYRVTLELVLDWSGIPVSQLLC